MSWKQRLHRLANSQQLNFLRPHPSTTITQILVRELAVESGVWLTSSATGVHAQDICHPAV